MSRFQPIVSASVSGGSGSGATLAVTLTQNGQGEQATWSVASVNVTNGGSGYTGLESVTFTPEVGAITAGGAFAEIQVGRVQPTITASATGGSGAALSVTLAEGFDWWSNQAYWYVDSVAVTNGGTGYTNGSSVSFTVTDGQESYAASATITTGVEEPTVSATVYANGTGATIAPTITQGGNRWSVTAAAITAAGSGYSQGDYIEFTSSDNVESVGYATVASVNGSGGITGLTIYSGGSYFRDNGIIEGVSVSSGGSYFKSTGIIQSVQVYDGGSYYKEQGTGQVVSDTPTVVISGNTGIGATATATVDATLGSPTFGKITAVNVTNGGSGYKDSGPVWVLWMFVGPALSVRALHRDEQGQFCEEVQEHAGVIAERTSTAACPTDLLSRSYKMFWIDHPPFGVGDCGTHCVSGNQVMFFDFGGGDITFSLSPEANPLP
jgi:hypothetical protein